MLVGVEVGVEPMTRPPWTTPAIRRLPPEIRWRYGEHPSKSGNTPYNYCVQHLEQEFLRDISGELPL